MSKNRDKAEADIMSIIRNFGGHCMATFVSLLSASNRTLITCVLSLWLMHWVSKGWERIGRAQQFNGDWKYGLHDLTIAAAIAILLGFTFFCNKSKRPSPEGDSVWASIHQQSKLLVGLRIGYLLTSCTTVLAFTAFYAIYSFDNSAKALACLMSDVGQYELAERFYSVAPDLNHTRKSGRFSSMATWHSSFTHEDPDTLRKKNAAVAAVYGSDSRQMAGRYFYLGLTCQQGLVDRDSEALYWHNKAFLLYQQNHAVTKCIDALAQMAILQLEKNSRESKRLLAHAERLMPSMNEEPFICTPILEPLARMNGNMEQSKLFSQCLQKSAPSPESRHWWPNVTLTVFAIFASGVAASIARELALSILTRRAAHVCSKETTRHSLVDSLNKLATLNLIRGNCAAADHNSSLALALAEGHCSLAAAKAAIITGAELRLSPFRRCELLRAFLALAITWSFYI